MAEYITKEQVIEWFRPYGHTDEGVPFAVLKNDVQEMLAADVAPVVHGKWVNPKGGFWEVSQCSVCGAWYPTTGIVPHYCPNCGAKMDGSVE